jgi:hypothetical protein
MAKRPAILMGLRFLFQKKKETCDTHGLAGESDEDMFAIRLERDHIRHDLVI